MIYGAAEGGREFLAASVAQEIKSRGGDLGPRLRGWHRLPVLKLLADPPLSGTTFHCTDADRPMLFERFATLLAIDDVATGLEALGFVDCEPRSLAQERPGFGVVIACRPR